MQKYKILFIAGLIYSAFGLGLSPKTTPVRSVAVLPTTDTTRYGLGPALQTALVQLLSSYRNFKPIVSEQVLGGFTKADIDRTFRTTQTDTVGFVYLEQQRVSVFLFDGERPSEFIVTYRLLNSPPQGKMTSQYIEASFREAVHDLITRYNTNQFEVLPGAKVEGNNLAKNEGWLNRQQVEDTKRLYRELAAKEESTYYLGAGIGMARYSGNINSNSTVNFGGYGGARISERVSIDAGFDFFTYALFHADGHYHLPLSEKYISLFLGLGFGNVLGSITSSKGVSSNNIDKGATVVGPSLSFDIPLLGATIRGDMRLYAGAATIFLGTYGIVFSL
jgi:hypothetical protein